MKCSAALLAAMLVGAPFVAATAPSVAAAAATDADTLSQVVPLPEVVVSTARLKPDAPAAVGTLDRKQIGSQNWGQDTPMLLSKLPGAYAYSDAGNGIGYSYLSIRGFPQRRISVLVNGVPLNDPESHEVYWIDHPDLLASTSEAQVQRGVGSALYGAASVGGSVNLETAPFSSEPAMRTVVGYGSFDTKRLMVEGISGRLPAGWDLYGRYSRIETLGYRDDSFSKLWSYNLTVRKQVGAHSFRLNFYGGPEETHLAYLGVPREVLNGSLTGDVEKDRKFNPITYENERDHFFEPHYEAMHSWTPRPNVAMTGTWFYNDGNGYYDEQRFGQSLASYRLTPWYTADTTSYPAEYFARDTSGAYITDAQGRRLLERADIVRRRTVENRHYGWLPRARIEHASGALTVGGELRAHDGRHFGEVKSGDGLPPGTPPDQAYYDYHPRTLSASLYAREEWKWRPQWLVTADLAWRHQAYHMQDDHFDSIEFDQTYDFGLPRLGLTWLPRPGLSAFASWAYSAREPAFRDLYDAEGVGSVPLFAVHDTVNNNWSDPLIDPEQVNDFEAGLAWTRGGLSGDDASLHASLNLFHMSFQDELVYAGQFNTDLGYPILGNAARSLHQGVELALGGGRTVAGGMRLGLEANATLSDNHFVEYHEYGDTVTKVVSYDGNAIGFFPATIVNAALALDWRAVGMTADFRHTGRIYLDATESKGASIGPGGVLDLTGRARFPAGTGRGTFRLRVLNVFDRRYETGGYMDFDSGVPVFIPAATRGVLGEVEVAW